MRKLTLMVLLAALALSTTSAEGTPIPAEFLP